MPKIPKSDTKKRAGLPVYDNFEQDFFDALKHYFAKNTHVRYETQETRKYQ